MLFVPKLTRVKDEIGKGQTGEFNRVGEGCGFALGLVVVIVLVLFLLLAIATILIEKNRIQKLLLVKFGNVQNGISFKIHQGVVVMKGFD